MLNFPIRVPAIKVEQPLGTFYAVSLTAEVLLQVCYTVKAEILDDDNESEGLIGALNKLTGTQRDRKESRLKEIERYTETVDASFPNSIILGANFQPDGKMVEDMSKRWRIEKSGECLFLVIPSEEQLASIIDGQHRVYGFKDSSKKDMSLICSIFLDLPMPYHAQIFTNINMNQKRVDKNLAYNLFQFDMNQGDIKSWSPETLAVYYARILAKNDNSPLKNQLKIGITDEIVDSSISMASIIDGILSLITSNPKKDRETLHSLPLAKRTRHILQSLNSSAPMRDLYIEGNDKYIYDVILNFFKVAIKMFWEENEFPIFKKTLGIHALFDFLKEIIRHFGTNYDYSEQFFQTLFNNVQHIDFNNEYFGVQSKVRARIKNVLYITSKLKRIEDLQIRNTEELTLLKAFLKIN